MISFVNFFKLNKKNTLFNKQYRSGYKNLWINSIRDYTP